MARPAVLALLSIALIGWPGFGGIADAAPTAPTIRVSITPSGGNPNLTYSAGTSISSDGRYVVFQSDAPNIVPGDGNGVEDIFVRDLVNNTTKRVTRAANGNLTNSLGTDANNSSLYPSISGNGRFVVYASNASNLVANDTNGVVDTFRTDVQTGVTTRQSVATNGTQANGTLSVPGSLSPAVSNDGRYVAFHSNATNLVSGDTNGVNDIFVRDNTNATTTRVSRSSGGAQANGTSNYPAMSGNGLYVVFQSAASTLVANDTNGVDDIFVHELATGKTTLASVDATGGFPNAASNNPSISDDGRYVAYATAASDVVGGDANFVDDVYVRDRTSATNSRVTMSTTGTDTNQFSSWPSLNASGSLVAFASAATNLVPGDTNGKLDVFVASRTGTNMRRVSLDSTGGNTDGRSAEPEISRNGRYVVYGSEASDVLPGGSDPTLPGNDSNGAPDIFRTDLALVPAEPGRPTFGAGASPLVKWPAPPANGRPDPTSYTVRAYEGSLDTTADQTIATGTTGLSRVVTGLTPGLAYRFSVAATNGNGTGADSQFTDFGVVPYASIPAWYADIFRRTMGRAPTSAADYADLGTWGTNVLKHQKSTFALIEGRMTSDYMELDVATVVRLYQAYFLRGPDTSGLTYWVGKRKSGTTLSTISAKFAVSSEFTRRYGSLSNRDFVKLLYKNVLGRTADSGGLSSWTAKLDTGRASRGQVMINFSESSEFKRTSTPMVQVVKSYFSLLGRAPGASTIATWSPHPFAEVIEHVYSSEEFADAVSG